MVLWVAEQAYHNFKEIANHCSTFYTIASTFVDRLSPTPMIFDVNSTLFKQFFSKVTSNNLQLELTYVNQDFIYKEHYNLNSLTSTWIYRWYSCEIHQRCSERSHAKPITYLVNISITTGIEPEELKQARVKPLFKKNSRSEIYKHSTYHF
jgi:hypothetical protein